MLRQQATQVATIEGVGITPHQPVTRGEDRSWLGPWAQPARLDNFWAGVQRLKELGWDLQSVEYQNAGSWCVFQRRPPGLAGS